MDCSTIHDYDKAAQGIYYFAWFSMLPYTLHCYKRSHIFGLSLFLVHLPFALVFSSAGDDVEQKHAIVKKKSLFTTSLSFAVNLQLLLLQVLQQEVCHCETSRG